MVLNYIWYWILSEVAILTPKMCCTSLFVWGVPGSFEDEICAILFFPQLNWNWRACNRNCFLLFFLDYLCVWSFAEASILALKVFTSEYVPQLTWIWRVYKRTCVFQWFWTICEIGRKTLICRKTPYMSFVREIVFIIFCLVTSVSKVEKDLHELPDKINIRFR